MWAFTVGLSIALDRINNPCKYGDHDMVDVYRFDEDAYLEWRRLHPFENPFVPMFYVSQDAKQCRRCHLDTRKTSAWF